MNKTIMTGNLGKDIETKISKDGKEFYVTTLAVKTGKDKITWVNLIFGDSKKFVIPYLKKGVKILCDGEISARGYKDKDGEVVANLQLSVYNVEMLDKKEEF